jgi:hypothetical protein
MNFLNSLLFLGLLLSFFWIIKADLFFMIFGMALLLYFVINSFFVDPFEILFTIGQFIFTQPLGLLILFIPLIIYGIDKGIQKLKPKKN